MRGRIPALVGLAVVAVIVGAFMARVETKGTLKSVEASPEPQHQSTVAETVTVHVSGMVMSPGVVDVPDGAIVADAIDAAGGLVSGAVIGRINLAAPVSAGEQIVVPGPGTAPDPPDGQRGEGLISLSSASADELESLPGVGPVLAERIVAFREQNGRFEAVEDLLEVPGIGEAKLAALRDLVRP